MSDFVIDPPRTPSVAVAATQTRFPLRRIFCVGRNYGAHAREMGSDPAVEPPFFFTKPADAVIDSGATIPYPPLTVNLHHEIELVVAIGKGGLRIDRDTALDHVWGYGVGIDLTRRDMQEKAKAMRQPWDWSKGFDRSALCGPLIRAEQWRKPTHGRIWLAVNDRIRQDADLGEMIWPVADIIALCSESVELRPGDLIFTGTPAGVGPLEIGDRIRGGIDGLSDIELSIGEARLKHA